MLIDTVYRLLESNVEKFPPLHSGVSYNKICCVKFSSAGSEETNMESNTEKLEAE